MKLNYILRTLQNIHASRFFIHGMVCIVYHDSQNYNNKYIDGQPD